MEKNIFENAYFGKAYKARDGRKVIYLGDNNFNGGEVYVAYEGSTSSHRIMKDGRYWATPNVNTDDDIISEWEEEELDKLALEYTINIPILDMKLGNGGYYNKGFKDGYKAAKRGE